MLFFNLPTIDFSGLKLCNFEHVSAISKSSWSITCLVSDGIAYKFIQFRRLFDAGVSSPSRNCLAKGSKAESDLM